MSRDQRSLIDYVGDVAQAVTNIQTYTEGMAKDTFLASAITKDAVVRNFEIIGEASRQLEKHYPEFVRQNNSLPFEKAYGMRNQLAHGYFDTNYDRVWKTIKEDLPAFLVQVRTVQTDLSVKGLDVQTPRSVVEQAQELLQSSGTSSEFQEAVIKEMEARLNLDNGIKTSDVGKNQRHH
jgi:uncharacterized protein with HEPN domain